MGAPAVAPRRAPARAPRPSKRSAGRKTLGGAAGTRRSTAARRTTPARTPAKRTSATGAAAKRAASRRSQARVAPRPNPALAGAALIPHAAVRTAGAVRDLSDSGLIVRLTAGRGWIAVLCALLGGIVALNVISLSINTTSGRVSQAIEEYEQRNSALRAELAETLSSSRVADAATALGLGVPGPEEVVYLDAQENDLQRLADALGGDTVMSTDASPSTMPTTTSTAYEEPGYAQTPTEPAAPSAAAPAPAAPLPTSPTPAPEPAPVPVPVPSGDGGSSGGIGL